MFGSHFRTFILTALAAFLFPPAATAQTGSTAGLPHFTAPPVTVTARKEPEDAQKVPLSVTAVQGGTLDSDGIRFISDASIFAPNVFYTEFTARKLSTAVFRGISSSNYNNPGITTYMDGVPMLHASAANLELVDVGRVEFVRGPQGSLFGRNTIGGLVNITSSRPALSKWTGSMVVPVGNSSAWDLHGVASGPLVTDKLGLSVGVGYSERDGFTVNDLTKHTLDNRAAFSAKGQLLWTPANTWEARVIVSGERARDGDYALNDLGAVRSNPFHVMRDFEGHTDRDVLTTSFTALRKGRPVMFSSTTGFVKWNTQDVTDLDYTAAPLLTRDNTERDFQFTEEVRMASAADSPVSLGAHTSLRWQAGALFFTQNYEQDAFNSYSPLLFGIGVTENSPNSSLDDLGIGVYGQGTATFNGRLDLTAGARVDYENKKADLKTSSVPPLFPATALNDEQSFSNVSPQVGAAFRIRPNKMLYGTVSRGFKAGGFNSASAVGHESYNEEFSWLYEGGVKTSWSGRASANLSVFYIDWDDMQLNVPNPFVPAQFYTANVGHATSSGVEVEVNARVIPEVDLFGAVGYTRARFADGNVATGINLSDHKVMITPDYTATFGAQFTHPVRDSVSIFGRAEGVFTGAFQYNNENTVGQDAYTLANFRGGVRVGRVSIDAWVRNAFDKRYVPFALPFDPSLAPSGFLAESGKPRTFGISGGVGF